MKGIGKTFMLKKTVLYIDAIKFVAYGYYIKNTVPRTLIIKTKVRGQLSAYDYSEIKTVTADDKVYNVSFQSMYSSDHEEWYFDILD